MCHNVLRMFVSLNDAAILNVKDVYYRFIINWIGKSEAVNLLQKFEQGKMSIIKIKKSFLHIKWVKKL